MNLRKVRAKKNPRNTPGTDVKDYYYSRAAGEGIEPSLRWLGSLQKEGALSQTLAPETKGCISHFHHPAVKLLVIKQRTFVLHQ